jgi:Tol biopolymer transport system component
VLAGTNVVVSKGPAGQAANFGSDRAAISENGNRIAFWSFASNLVAGDTNGLWDIFVYQHSDGSMRRVSLRADGGERNQGESTSAVHQPAISGNGRFVAYPTASSDVVSGDTNGVHDIFVVDLDAAGLDVRRASVGPGNVQGNAASGSATYWEHIALSYDGTWMAFVSDATNFGTTTQTTGLRNVFLRNLGTGEIRVLTDSSIFSNQVSISRSGAYVSFTSGLVLDSRFASSGGYAHFTNLERAWFWVD